MPTDDKRFEGLDLEDYVAPAPEPETPKFDQQEAQRQLAQQAAVWRQEALRNDDLFQYLMYAILQLGGELRMPRVDKGKFVGELQIEYDAFSDSYILRLPGVPKRPPQESRSVYDEALWELPSQRYSRDKALMEARRKLNQRREVELMRKKMSEDLVKQRRGWPYT